MDQLTKTTREILLSRLDNLKDDLESGKSILHKSDDDFKQMREIELMLLSKNIEAIKKMIIENEIELDY